MPEDAYTVVIRYDADQPMPDDAELAETVQGALEHWAYLQHAIRDPHYQVTIRRPREAPVTARYLSASHPERTGITGAKARIIDTLHTYSGWVTTARIAADIGKDLGYTRRLLGELHDQGAVRRADDAAPGQGGPAPSVWHCCNK